MECYIRKESQVFRGSGKCILNPAMIKMFVLSKFCFRKGRLFGAFLKIKGGGVFIRAITFLFRIVYLFVYII